MRQSAYNGKKRLLERIRSALNTSQGESDAALTGFGRTILDESNGAINRLSSSRIGLRGSSSSLSVSGIDASAVKESCLVKGLGLIGSRGRMMKKLIINTTGRQAEAKMVALTLSPNVVVAKAYAPAPIKPAPPVPLPHAARLRGP